MGTWAEVKANRPTTLIQTKENFIMAKTATFAAVHFTVAFSVGYALTGSVLIGGTMALVEPAINTVAFYFHEMGWKRFEENKAVLEEALANSV